MEFRALADEARVERARAMSGLGERDERRVHDVGVDWAGLGRARLGINKKARNPFAARTPCVRQRLVDATGEQ